MFDEDDDVGEYCLMCDAAINNDSFEGLCLACYEIARQTDPEGDEYG